MSSFLLFILIFILILILIFIKDPVVPVDPDLESVCELCPLEPIALSEAGLLAGGGGHVGFGFI